MKSRAVGVSLGIALLLQLQGCQTLKEGADVSYVVREHGTQQERVEDANRRELIRVSIESGKLSIYARELVYSTMVEYPVMQQVQISDRTLSRFLAAGGVFFTAGVGYFDKDFDRMWGDERVESKVVNSWPDRNKGRTLPNTTQIKRNPLNDFARLSILGAYPKVLVPKDLFRESVQFVNGVVTVDLERLAVDAKPGKRIDMTITLEQPTNLRPIPPPFSFSPDWAVQRISYLMSGTGNRGQTTKVQSNNVLNDDKITRCKRMGIDDQSIDFDLCLKSLK